MKGFNGAIGFMLFYAGFIGFVWILTYLGFTNDIIGGGSNISTYGTGVTYKNETSSLSALETFASIYTKQAWLSWLIWGFTAVFIWIIISWIRGITP